MFTVALTGGIATGKSIVARNFADLGVSIIDADQINRNLIDNSPGVRAELVGHFGKCILKKNATLDKDKLRALIFASPKEREWLEELLHPLIFREIKSSIQKTTGIYNLLVIPLLFESKTSKLLKKKPSSTNFIQLDRVLLVSSSRELQIQRVRERDLLEKKQIESILAVQISPEESINRADDVIQNDTSLLSLRNSTLALHEKYLSLLAPSKLPLDDSPFLGYYLVFK